MFNEYKQYAILANDYNTFGGDKIQVDLDRLDKMSDFHEVEDFIAQNYGQLFDNGINLDFPNGIELAIRKENNAIEIVVIQGEFLIFSKGWRLVKKENKNDAKDN